MIRDFENEDPYGPQNHPLPTKSGAGVRSLHFGDTRVPTGEKAIQRRSPWLCGLSANWRDRAWRLVFGDYLPRSALEIPVLIVVFSLGMWIGMILGNLGLG